MKHMQSLKYFFNRYVLKREYLIATENKFGSRFKFKIEDVVGRHIYKKGEYEKDLTDFLSSQIKFEQGDIALDIGANIGWYSILLNNIMPDGCQVHAFEPDPLNHELLLFNMDLNKGGKIIAVNKALSNKNEIKKLYRYANKNLGRHSLLDINQGEFVEVEAVVLDEYFDQDDIDFNKVKFIKIDIEGYEYFALQGANKVLDSARCVISEFVPTHMKKGGVDPVLLIELLQSKGFESNIVDNGVVKPVSTDALVACDACDIIWLKSGG